MKNNYFLLLTAFLLTGCMTDYEKAQKEINLGHYDNALFLLEKIEMGSSDYSDAQLKITKINEIIYKENNISSSSNLEDSSLNKSDEQILIQNKIQIQKLYNELMIFKNESYFHQVGFAVCCEYNRWLTDIQDLKHSSDMDELYDQGYAVISLETVGQEYRKSHGKETKISRLLLKNHL
ncbi:hypothetical protein [Flavobacterium sandaracinum]|uniref:Uncharacterized protein n=1 Tax=Flavobacterium sandaracinum TaxID=2541733 RepID=A0A4R5D0S3_9FLAO|nr:hypothetical protein [Flavobacterium sandaracinum]TDE05827.1 hypothetical protein E0F91_06440 [Flavobacterium sandaracinum]